VLIDVAVGGDDRQPAGERELVADQRQPRSVLDLRPVDEREHSARGQSRGLAAGTPRRLQPLEEFAPPVIVDRLLERDDVVACKALRDRLGALGDVWLVARPFAQHVADQRQVGRDELDVVAGDLERAVRRRELAPVFRAAGAAEGDQGAGKDQGRARSHPDPARRLEERAGKSGRFHRPRWRQ
jgi:hypothetical protein